MIISRICYLTALCVAVACCTNKGPSKGDAALKAPSKQRMFKLEHPASGAVIKAGDALGLRIGGAAVGAGALDSCVLRLDGRRLLAFRADTLGVPTDGWRMGSRRLALQLYGGGGVRETISFSVRIVPAAPPTRYAHRVVREYPHDEGAYTQGLCYHGGALYEGTGQLKASSLRRVRLESGEVLQRVALADEYFGEGICIVDGRVIQLTWLNRTGFIYGLDDFALEGTFRYPTEGWGLTTDGERIWMSDGTANLYLLKRGTLEVVDQLEVYSDKGPVTALNELEYIKGEIWANVYGEDYIVRIDPATGAVLGSIDLAGILRDDLRKPGTDVLNGIAYDVAADRVFVTGKNWPRLFEIKVERR